MASFPVADAQKLSRTMRVFESTKADAKVLVQVLPTEVGVVFHVHIVSDSRTSTILLWI